MYLKWADFFTFCLSVLCYYMYTNMSWGKSYEKHGNCTKMDVNNIVWTDVVSMSTSYIYHFHMIFIKTNMVQILTLKCVHIQVSYKVSFNFIYFWD